MTTLASHLASLIEARANCLRMQTQDNEAIKREWFHRHTNAIRDLAENHLPSGAGIDSGTTVDLDKSHSDRLVFHVPFHHMNESGMYDGWSDYTVIVTPSFNGHHIRVTGRDRNDTKNYLGDLFTIVLDEPYTEKA